MVLKETFEIVLDSMKGYFQVDLPRVCLCTPLTWECKETCRCLKCEDVAGILRCAFVDEKVVDYSYILISNFLRRIIWKFFWKTFKNLVPVTPQLFQVSAERLCDMSSFVDLQILNWSKDQEKCICLSSE